jgi:hypothetical protein
MVDKSDFVYQSSGTHWQVPPLTAVVGLLMVGDSERQKLPRHKLHRKPQAITVFSSFCLLHSLAVSPVLS